MVRLRAPSARRTPISRVRSRTDTSMMFMMPMPPTSRVMQPDADRHAVQRAGELLVGRRRAARVRLIAKSSGSPGRRAAGRAA